MRGSAVDTACPGLFPSGVRSVAVALSRYERVDGTIRCRHVRPDGTLASLRRCKQPLPRIASGISPWRLKATRPVRPGLYRIRVSAVDAAGNTGPESRTRLRLR